MTDKQIIIDGVDVSGCQYYKIPQNEMYPMSNFCGLPCIGFCKNDTKCSYKQWKRKEQECEELKNEIINRNEKIEELRFSVSDLTNRLCDLNAEKSFRIVDLEQTLAEIKELCKKESGWVNCSNNMPTETAIFAEQILQKISEVEDGQ